MIAMLFLSVSSTIMVHCDRRHYIYAFWLRANLNPETKLDRDNYPDGINLDPTLDGGSTSMFWASLNMSYCVTREEGSSNLELWHELLDNWDKYDAEFREDFKRDLQRFYWVYSHDKEPNCCSTKARTNAFFRVALEINEKCFHYVFIVPKDQPKAEEEEDAADE